ncbi:hypothetical protein [Cellulomonas fengjieae]|uniref:hypothetical protein n=1 Tax=Cellulomonas fengjieae TaxID=2819978 RepID=UPI001AAEF5C7|nr:hypothetical protein [Cellulomonas fengjieae]MBO3100603.1 hypothetical protein [Cellulomonas fengjieae]
MLRRRSAVLGIAALIVLVPGVAQAGGRDEDPAPATPPAVTPVAAGEGVEVTVSQSGSTSSGRQFTSPSRSVRVLPSCWYGQGMTGFEYYEYWKPGGPARQAPTLDAFAAQGLLHKDFESHATDTEGHWYEAECRYDIPSDEATRYVLSHPAVWVGPTDTPPATEVVVDPAVLAQVASDAMDLPTGTIRWNPSLAGSGATVVGASTWLWVEDAPTTVTVRAEIPGTWAQVDAVLSGLEASAPGADTVHCPDAGTPWSEGATSTTCAITFLRSTANQPVKTGQSQRTTTLTARATWTASWTSSLDATPTPLPSQTLTATAEIPVAEVQSIVGR